MGLASGRQLAMKCYAIYYPTGVEAKKATRMTAVDFSTERKKMPKLSVALLTDYYSLQ